MNIFIYIFKWTFMIIATSVAFVGCLLAAIGNTIWEWGSLIIEFIIKPFVMIYIWAIGFWSFISNVYIGLFKNLEQK